MTPRHNVIRRVTMIVLPHQVVPEGRQDEPPGQDGEPEHQAGDDWENHRDQEINEEGDEGPEGEDGGHDDDDEHVGDQPGQEELSPGQLDSHVEEDGGGQVGERGDHQQGEENTGPALQLCQPPQQAPADLKHKSAVKTEEASGIIWHSHKNITEGLIYRGVPFLLDNPGCDGLYEVCPGEVWDDPEEEDGEGGDAGQAGGDGGDLDDPLQGDALSLPGAAGLTPSHHFIAGRENIWLSSHSHMVGESAGLCGPRGLMVWCLWGPPSDWTARLPQSTYIADTSHHHSTPQQSQHSHNGGSHPGRTFTSTNKLTRKVSQTHK